MRAHLTVLSVAVVLAMTAGAEARAATDPHLRPADAADSALVADAVARSSTVRALADRLKETDLVAYVRVSPSRRGAGDSSISFLGRSRVQRFMVITINRDLALDRQVALIGHELQHAVDMSRVSWVSSPAHLHAYLATTGWKSAYPERVFETYSALRTERQVSRELAAAERGAGTPRPLPR